MAADLVLADPHLGPVSPCGWADYAQVMIANDPHKRVGACALPGSDFDNLCVPSGWRFVGSRSEALALFELDDQPPPT